MTMIHKGASLGLILCCLCLAAIIVPAAQAADSALPTSTAASLGKAVAPAGQVALVEFGADYCPPCKLMAPILKAAEKDYKGRATVVSLDVTRYPELATRAGVRVIPTLIFYDAQGREALRHTGYMDRAALRGQLDKLLAN
jgi:thioredoxin 1